MEGIAKQFRVGNARDPRDDDPYFNDELEALNAAGSLSDREANWSEPIAVWDADCDIVHLFLCGQQFRAN